MDVGADWVDDGTLTAEETLARLAALAPLDVAPLQRVTVTRAPVLAWPLVPARLPPAP